MSYEDRLQRLRTWIKQQELDGVILYSRENTRYFTGFTGSESTALITPDMKYLFTDARYIEQASQQSPSWEVVDTTMTGIIVMTDTFAFHNLDRIGVEDECIPLSLFQRLESLAPDVTFHPVRNGLSDLRARKDSHEIQLLTEAVRIADQAFAHILNIIRPGITEQEVAVELEFAMRRNGASGISFDTIVASGTRGALPHGVATGKPIMSGDCVVMDFGCIYEGYCSDITRTVFVGDVDAELFDIYDHVLNAQCAVEEKLSGSISGSDADDIARQIISDAGYGACFGHSLGHGVGLAVHENPRLSRSNPGMLLPGHVVTVEPGIYLPGKGGVRIEDMVVIEKNGSTVLTGASKDKIRL